MAALSRAGLQAGCSSARIAAAPATSGAENEVPEPTVYRGSIGKPRLVPAARAPVMLTPGAVTSGLIAKVVSTGPRLEKNASRSWPSTAPTDSAALAAAGDPIDSSAGPEFPAAATNST